MPRGELYSLLAEGLRRRRSAFAGEHCQRDLFPLDIERLLALRLARAAVPVARITEIAFLAMQICMNPCAGRIVDVLRNLVGRVPVTLGVVPQRTKRKRQC